ncbi:Sau3AI family type II restriction endonuclease [Staphylococcus aureus]
MDEKIWDSVEEVHEHASKAVNKKIKDLVTNETVQKYYANTNNKGWIGNAIESDWFKVPNNSRKEADIPYLDLEIKVTPIRETKKGWSAKERLVLNIFDFNDEYKRNFLNASFIEKSNLIELLYYEYKKNVDSPNLKIKAATLFNFDDLPEEDLLIIEQDWNIIIDKIKEGKAEELSDSLTKYLGATTKGSKTEKNLTKQPFSDIKAHRRAFTLKGAYMTELAKKNMALVEENEKVIKNVEDLKNKSFENLILERFQPYIGKSKNELAQIFNVAIPEKNDKASSATLAKKMLNLKGEIENTEEFKKSGISVKILTINPISKKATEGFKIIIPGEQSIEPEEIIKQDWEDSSLKDYLSSNQFLLVIFEKYKDKVIFKGAKFWRVNYNDLETTIKNTWVETKRILENGVRLEYIKMNKPTSTGKLYKVSNNLPGIKDTKALHVRPSAKVSCYYNNPSQSMKLPVPSKWINKPQHTDWIDNTKPLDIPTDELTEWYMTKQLWWLNPTYMYQQVKEFFKK